MNQNIKWKEIEKRAKKMTAPELEYAIKDCLECEMNQGKYTDEAGIYRAELKKRAKVRDYDQAQDNAVKTRAERPDIYNMAKSHVRRLGLISNGKEDWDAVSKTIQLIEQLEKRWKHNQECQKEFEAHLGQFNPEEDKDEPEEDGNG